ncbi:TPA: hypothetical protein DIV48_00560 [Candidatus Kaiserbacteria bacterium]|nr:MAG: hypothetical protein UY93_C0002G0427 [Parcubacteria group bacterium GW2011_GWA1_56_13]KKW45681.1 MAG: hypothetical protein UY97_C0017G0011 [Parcubacteria group bacterium GW2011_GWB1_57_6]HCR52123.1 hypothetical protein [Candidatus Kaiserbacteria bacterium]
MLSIAIPSRNERFLKQTIEDVLKNATGEIEVFPILDGYEPPTEELVHDSRVTYLRIPLGGGETHKRHGINTMAERANGQYIMALDAHCMVAPGFDMQLAKDHQPNWVQVPRRHRLDAEHWCLQTQVDDRPPIDYEYTMYPEKFDPKGLHGFKWDARTRERSHIPIDETMHIQGSAWFMTKEWFKHVGLMQIEGYSGWGQEGEEIVYKTKRAGGKTMSNKNTWYAHLHKGPKYGRMYFMSRESMRACNKFSYNYWVYEDRKTFENMIDQFWPLPSWPTDWRKRIWG